MRRPIFVNNEIYHIYNRGADKRRIFMDDSDYFRFIHDLYEFNNEAPAVHSYYFRSSNRSSEVGPRKIDTRRKLIVEILAFCLMPNHFHLLLRQIVDRGIERFMQKLGGGYTMYFNKKYERSGVLFQGKFKAVLVENDAQLLHLPYYIHSNPLDLIEPHWREHGIKDLRKAMEFLTSYRWSSFLDYIGKKNFPSVISRDFITEIVGSPEEYKELTANWLKEREWHAVEDLCLE
jgi:putative transposase